MSELHLAATRCLCACDLRNDHFTQINDQRLRTAADAVRAAADTASANSSQREPRLCQLQNYLTELRQLRISATAPATDRPPTVQRAGAAYV